MRAMIFAVALLAGFTTAKAQYPAARFGFQNPYFFYAYEQFTAPSYFVYSQNPTPLQYFQQQQFINNAMQQQQVMGAMWMVRPYVNGPVYGRRW